MQRTALVSVFAVVFTVGCFLSHDDDDDDASDGDADTDADGDADPCGPPEAVDLLMLIDNSGSMAQEQASLTMSFGALPGPIVEAVAANGVGSLHVGVISTDLGTGGFAVQTCDDTVNGDDGILLHEPTDLMAGCEASYPSYLSWQEGEDTSDVAEDFACIGTLGTGGCGFEQQLKAVRRALTLHRDGPNAGFLRDDSLLVILMLTDEEDCSVREDVANATDIFNTQLALGPMNLRCYNHRDQYVEPVESFVDDLLATRPCPERLAIFGMVGIPPGTRHQCNLDNMTDRDFQCLLDLPDMQEVIDNSAEGKGERLVPSCDEAGLGEAFPPRRIVETIRQLGDRGAAAGVGSICEMAYGPAIQRIVDALRPRLGD